MTTETHEHEHEKALAHRKKAWAKMAPRYDKQIGFFERRVFGPDHRTWACSKAEGNTLEVAVGTGLNLPHYPPGISLTGLDLSAEMLSIAKQRAEELGLEVDLHEGDAQALPFPADHFDTVLSTYSLCNIPDEARAVSEMKRVLKPGGRLVLVDHIRSAVKPIYWGQKVMELFTVRIDGDHMTRRPLEHVKAQGFDVVERQRYGVGAMVERLVARKPEASS